MQSEDVKRLAVEQGEIDRLNEVNAIRKKEGQQQQRTGRLILSGPNVQRRSGMMKVNASDAFGIFGLTCILKVGRRAITQNSLTQQSESARGSFARFLIIRTHDQSPF